MKGLRYRHLMSTRAFGLAFLVLVGCGEGGTPDAGLDGARRDGGMSCVATADDFPTPTTGVCTVTVNADAELTAGDDGAGGFIVPGGERLTRVGRNAALGGFPMRGIAIPGTRFVVITDGGLREETLSVVDVDTLAIVDREDLGSSPAGALFLGLAVSSDGSRLWVSGGGTSEVLAYDVDTATGALTHDAAASFSAALDTATGYVAGLALRDDGLLAVVLMFGDEVLFWDTTTNTEVRRVPVEETSRPYDVVFTPDGSDVWVSLWANRQVVRIGVGAGVVEASLETGKNPEGLALSSDGATIAVACSDSDSVVLIDVVSGLATETIWVIGEDAPRGVAPASVRFGSDGRLYVVNALENAIDVFVPDAGSYRRVGAVPTMWHPTDVLPLDDGTLVFINGRDTGTGPNNEPARDDITSLLGGSVSVLDPGTWDDAQLAAWEMEIDANNTRMSRFVDVDCGGAANDFPIPRPGEGPSTQIRHVVLIVRENKTYDAYLGDLQNPDGTPHGNGDPSLTLIPAADIADILPNTRALALEYAIADNYYSHAEQSVQGHFWTTHGRTTDFVERTWLTSWGRGYWTAPPQGTSEVGSPEEGSVFDFLLRNNITATNYGEVVGTSALRPDRRYPGLVYSYLPDIEKADFIAATVQACTLRSFTYVVLPNDHTRGRSPGQLTPESMIADNDEGVGRIVEGISHSTFWPETVIFVIEDDPQDGGDHVDNHRSPLHVISPWVRRGHVSSVHVSEASLFRTLQLILGVAEPHNRSWELAAPLYDMFTSTPDYSPYDRVARRWPDETNPADGSMMATISESYDWSRPDEQPGLSRLLWRYFHGTDAPWPVPQEPLAGQDEDGD